MTERFIIDDCSTLIDMTNRNTYDYVSDVVTLLNELHEENMQLHQTIFELRTELALQRTEKEEDWDSVDDFLKKLEKW